MFSIIGLIGCVIALAITWHMEGKRMKREGLL